MADMTSADTYFSKTTREDAWLSHPEAKREVAISEAAMMIGLLSCIRQPPTINLDNATHEQAYCLIESDSTRELASLRAAGLKSKSAADSSESYAGAAELRDDPCWISGVYYSPHALAWLDGYYLRQGAVRTGKMV